MLLDEALKDVRFRFTFDSRIFLDLNNGSSYFIKQLDITDTEFSVTRSTANKPIKYSKSELINLIDNSGGINLKLTLFFLRGLDTDLTSQVVTEF